MGADFTVLSPYIYKTFDIKRRNINLGDGFILRAIERRVGDVPPDRLFTTRLPLTESEIRKLDANRTVLMAGANQLQDDFSPWSGLTADDIRKSNLRFVPFGIGLSGKPGGGVHLTEPAKDILRVMHERIEYSSWRCPRTVAILEEALPELTGRFLMTCCPVALDKPLLDSASFHDGEATIAVTHTDRDDFWDREATTLEKVAELYPNKRKLLVLHQDLSRIGTALRLDRSGLPRSVVGDCIGFRSLARKLGYEIVRPRTLDEGMRLYREEIDIHFGSRLHAHLFMLSNNKRSFLTHVDERMNGFSEFLGFPMCDPHKFETYLDFDFETVRRNAQKAEQQMQTFVSHIF